MNELQLEIKKSIEAILFACGEAITYDKLASLHEITTGQVKELIKELSQTYDDRGIQLLMYDNSCQLCTKEKYEGIIKDALGIKKNGALSKSCLETLAIIAYNQPVTRAYVEEVRGVDSAYTFGVLLQRELIDIKGKLDVPGRPNLYVTNENFLRIFGLSSIKELPKIDILASNNEDEKDKTDD